MEETVDAISRAVCSLICQGQYPDKIIIGEDAFNEVVVQMKKRGMEGLKVNLMGQYTLLFGMRIEIDQEKKKRIDFEKDGHIISASVLDPYEWFAKEVEEKKFYRFSEGFFSYFGMASNIERYRIVTEEGKEIMSSKTYQRCERFWEACNGIYKDENGEHRIYIEDKTSQSTLDEKVYTKAKLDDLSEKMHQGHIEQEEQGVRFRRIGHGR